MLTSLSAKLAKLKVQQRGLEIGTIEGNRAAIFRSLAAEKNKEIVKEKELLDRIESLSKQLDAAKVVIPAKSAGCSGSNRPRVPAENGRWFRSKSAT